MITQPIALLLAEKLEQQFPLGTAQHYLDGEAAAELRRLSAQTDNDTAVLRQALEVLESVYPYTDSLICYASTVDEHPPNAIDGNVRDALTALRERLGEKT